MLQFVKQTFGRLDLLVNNAGVAPNVRADLLDAGEESFDRLIGIIRDRELENGEVLHLTIPHNDARVIARLHELAEVYEQRVTDGAMLITAWIPRDALHYFEAYAAATLLQAAKVS